MVIGALSQCTENIRLGFGVTLMPHAFTPPMRVAEKVATADILSGGRVEWGTGRSTPMEQIAFGVDREQSRDQAAEAIRSIVAMWEDEYFEWDSEFLDFPRRMVTPKPVQDPHPPAWMAATTAGSAEIAGEAGLGLLSFSIMQPLELMAQQIEAYRAAIADPAADHPGRQQPGGRLHARALRRDDGAVRGQRHLGLRVVVVQEPRRVHHRVGAPAPHQGRSRTRSSRSSKRQMEGDFDPHEFSDADMIVVGDPEQCLEKMLHYEELGVDQLICYVQFGHLSHESVMRTIELLGTEIIPELRRREIDARTVTAS